MMRRNPKFFRLATTVAMTALLSGTLSPPPAAAQPAPTPGLIPPPGQNQGDPPARVGRIARVSGQVSYHTADDAAWSAASHNYPVSSGDAFWTEPAASAALEVSDSRIVLAGGTEFDVTTLDAGGLQAVAAQGEVYLRLRDLAPDEVWTVQTPRGLVRLGTAGRYAIVIGTTEQPTLVTVLEGAADIQGPGLSLQVSGNQTAMITGTGSFTGSIGPAQRDGFLTAQLEAERPRPAAVAVPQYVAAMPGGSDLAETGSWSQVPQYGQVWYPQVSPGWVPYRHGHWAYVAPWGWTWVDDASWGFAPSHYDRWVEVDGRWAWTPGGAPGGISGPAVVTERPVYAPALVAFVGLAAGAAVGAALASRTVGWVPLGPREPYRPWYHASDGYVRQMNVNHVTNVTTINTSNVTVNNFINRGAATAVPAAAMMESRPVQAVAQPLTAQQLAAAGRWSGSSRWRRRR
ncbi:MAG: DUF6600 domain-containing protein [Rhodopila sp.]